MFAGQATQDQGEGAVFHELASDIPSPEKEHPPPNFAQADQAVFFMICISFGQAFTHSVLGLDFSL